jgi:hypothetical protein
VQRRFSEQQGMQKTALIPGIGAVIGGLTSKKGRTFDGVLGGALTEGTTGLGAALGGVSGFGLGALSGAGLGAGLGALLGGGSAERRLGLMTILAHLGGLGGAALGTGAGAYGGYRGGRALTRRLAKEKGSPWKGDDHQEQAQEAPEKEGSCRVFSTGYLDGYRVTSVV